MNDDRQERRPREEAANPEAWRPGPKGSTVADIEHAADEALASGTPVWVHDVMVVPDVIITEGAANGHPVPDTHTLLRHDGRVAYLFRHRQVAS